VREKKWLTPGALSTDAREGISPAELTSLEGGSGPMKMVYSNPEAGAAELIRPDDDSIYMPESAYVVDLPDELVTAYLKAKEVYCALELVLFRAAREVVESGRAELYVFGSMEDQDAADAREGH
jgi:hypothetical protein